MDIRAEKKEIRIRVLSLRDSLNEKEREYYSRKIYESFFSLSEIKDAKVFFLFVNFRTEVNTRPIIERLLSENKKVVIPYTDIVNKRLILCYVDSLDNLKEGSYGILEPDPKICQRADAKDIDIAVIPGSVFDVTGGRVGYGGGFYDRTIPLFKPTTLKIAITFDIQIVEKVPMGYYDKKMDVIISEKRIIRIKNAES